MAIEKEDPRVEIAMGSQSDYVIVQPAEEIFREFDVPHEVRIVSAHRTPDRLAEYAKSARARGLKAIVACAGGAAHLPGMIAAHTTVPVLGVPAPTEALGGEDSLLSIVQMPGGVPVATFAIGKAGAKNAALTAIAILANEYPDLLDKLEAWRRKQTKDVMEFPVHAPDVGSLIVTGKTKSLLRSTKDQYNAYALSHDMVTWADKYALAMPEKGKWSNTVSCNLFVIFKQAGLPVAFRRKVDDRTFETELCEMFPYEIVACGIVDEASSYRKRNPNVPAGTVFEDPIVQFHLKTSGKRYNDRDLPCDDPLMVFSEEGIGIYLPSKPIGDQQPIFFVPQSEIEKEFPGIRHWRHLTDLTKKAFVTAREAYKPVGGRLFDGKWEYGRRLRPDIEPTILMADVFDADSMRLTVNGARADKQVIRNGGAAAASEQVAAYKLAVATSQLLLQ